MRRSIATEERKPVKEGVRSALEEVLCMGGQKLLQAAIENEATECEEQYRAG